MNVHYQVNKSAPACLILNYLVKILPDAFIEFVIIKYETFV